MHARKITALILASALMLTVSACKKNSSDKDEQTEAGYDAGSDTGYCGNVVLEDGTVIEHSHDHTHSHTHQNTKAVINRLAKAIGHLEKVKRMVENGEDCSEVLIQLSAVRSAINNTGKIILQDHIEHCLVDAVESGDTEAIKELNEAIERFVK